MADNKQITDNLLEMYGRNDWIMRANFNFFIKLSSLDRVGKQKQILDCGCGMGHFIQTLKNKGFTSVSGIDASPEMVDAARSLFDVQVALCDVLDLSKRFADDSLDVVIISDLFHHLESTEEWTTVIRTCNDLLRAGGKLIIREPYPNIPLLTLWKMSRIGWLHKGPLKARLQSFIEEDRLLKFFFANWPANYKSMLADHGFTVEKDFNWLVHRITVCSTRNAA